MPRVLHVDRIDVPHCPNAIVSSFAKALTKNSSKPLLMPPELMNVHGTNALFAIELSAVALADS